MSRRKLKKVGECEECRAHFKINKRTKLEHLHEIVAARGWWLGGKGNVYILICKKCIKKGTLQR